MKCNKCVDKNSSISQLRQPMLRPIEALSGFGGDYRSRKEGRNFDYSNSWRILPDSRVLASRPHDLRPHVAAKQRTNMVPLSSAKPPASKLDFREY